MRKYLYLTTLRMYLTDLEVFILVWDFINTHTLYFGVSNIECEGESVRLYRLVVAFIADVISTKISSAGPNIYVLLKRLDLQLWTFFEFFFLFSC